MLLPDGYHDVPAGSLATVVTSLEMRAPVPSRPERDDSPWALRLAAQPGLDWYRDLYRRVGADWLWSSRLALSDAALAAILGAREVTVYALTVDGRDAGILELDFREPGQCELAFFGVTKPVMGTGAARWLMNRAIAQAWARPISRFWVHTCTLDSPDALPFYVRSGFVPFARAVEVYADPRVAGVLPRDAAPQVPILEPDC